VTPFFLLFVERAGSTHLVTLLDSHPALEARREEFAVLRQQGKSGADQLAWARSFWGTAAAKGVHARGFKSKIVDILDPQGFVQLLHEQECRVITLRRQNTVKGVVSTANAKRLHDTSGNWNLLKQEDRMPAFAIDPAQFDAMLHQREQWDRELQAFVAGLRLPLLSLFYEEILAGEAGVLQRVVDFLGVEFHAMQPKIHKHTGDDLRDVLTNYDDLRRRYADTQYAAMFDEVIA
jgi:hypothetical protein